MTLNRIMERCLQCNSTLTAAEKECFTCGATVPEKNPKASLSERFQLVVKILFIVSAVMTVVLIFTDFGSSVLKGFAATLVLFLVKNSADHMSEAKKG